MIFSTALAVSDFKITRMKFSTKILFEILGVFSVVLSLLFLTYEIRQSNRIAIASAEIEVMNNAASFNELRITDGGLRDALTKASSIEGTRTLTADEELIVRGYATRFFNLALAKEAAYQNGVLSEESLNRSFEDISMLVQSPGLRTPFRALVDRYSATSTDNLIIRFTAEALQEYASD